MTHLAGPPPPDGLAFWSSAGVGGVGTSVESATSTGARRTGGSRGPRRATGTTAAARAAGTTRATRASATIDRNWPGWTELARERRRLRALFHTSS